MKILFFINSIPPQYGGGYLRVFKIASRFKVYGTLFKIATFTPRSLYKDYLGISKYDIIFIPNKIMSFISFLYNIFRYRNEFDVFYVASTQWFTVLPVILCKILKKKIILGITLSGVDSPAVKKHGPKKIYYLFKNWQFRFANFLFVNSPLLVEECCSCGYPKEMIKLINNPVDISIFHPINYQEKEKIKSNLCINNSNLTILFVGSVNKRKGADLLPEIFKQYFARVNKKINFIICGQDCYTESDEIISSLEQIFKKNNSTFIFKREVKDVHIFYKITDIFLFPTTNEGMPNVILEAMATGCMIICNTLPGITDYTLSENFLIHNNDINEYVDRIIDYEANKEYYNHLIHNNINIIKDNFSINKIDKQIKDIILK